MRDVSFHVRALLDLPTMADERERRASFRQATTALAQAGSEEGLLRSVPPEAIANALRIAIADGLCETLDWLPKSDAAVALYELASGAGASAEKRELGRRLLTRLTTESAQTVAVLSARMAQSSAKSIGTPQARARISLVFEVPLHFSIRSGPLALALVSRRELAHEWLEEKSIGSLPERRLAARILERAAREALSRAKSGDDHALKMFSLEHVGRAMKRLFADRESLVWRHVAVARGLLAAVDPSRLAEVENALDPKLGMTEWRRAATSVLALATGDAAEARRLTVKVFELSSEDPGIVGAFAWGLPFALEAEPEVAEELIMRISPQQWPHALEGFSDSLREVGSASVVDRIREAVLTVVRRSPQEPHHIDIVKDIEFGSHRPTRLSTTLSRAIAAFAEEGASAAFALARKLLDDAPATLKQLSEDQATSYSALRDIDRALLEHNAAAHLVALGGADVPKLVERLELLRDEACEWLLGDVAEGDATSGLHLKRFQALVHLADTEGGDAVIERTRRVIRRLVALQAKHSGSTKRPILATFVRALDAQARFEKSDATQSFMLLTSVLRMPEDFDTAAEATMLPELSHMLTCYAAFHRTITGVGGLGGDKPDSMMPTAVVRPSQGMAGPLSALRSLASDLVPEATPHGEALRLALSKLHSSLASIEHAPSLRAAASPGVDALPSLESAVGSVAQLAAGARIAFGVAGKTGRSSMTPSDLVTGVLDGRLPTMTDAHLNQYADAVSDRLPQALASLVSGVVYRLSALPHEAGGKSQASMHAIALPPWVPARRTLGGFYIVRSLGGGAAGSVFLVTRIEERNEPDAEHVALKVPDYSASASRTLSEAEFMQLFREEAAALIGLPAHPNLARFVTFDVGAKPKPILVMEYVEGTTLEQEISGRTLTMERALSSLQDVLSGLEAMHAAGIAHLDIKPSNIILRGGKEAVLVDFGLAGRKIRPGCATGPYGAPEVWGAFDGPPGPPMPADVYAFACVAYEVLTAETLLDAPSELALISKHIAHDGSPEGVKQLAKAPRSDELAQLLFAALRREPGKRMDVKTLRAEFGKVAKKLHGVKWPITV